MEARGFVHTQTRRIVMSEVDASQIHFTAIYRWIDRGFSEYLAEIGHPFSRLLEEGPGVPIVDTRCRFLRRIVLDDVITVHTWVAGVGRTSFRSRHHFLRGDELVAEGELVHVCVNRSTREPVPVPEWLRERAFHGDVIPY
jgi:acyl-CoA thioester hydrolase